ncbi:MAG: hypothetical protein GYA32_00610 [Serratia sp.]|nr:hypothetical protein [Serratia sp. (in: enterobacteria)]
MLLELEIRMKTPKYTQKTVQKFMSYLDEIGLSVHGNYMEGNKEFHGLMDYNSADIVNRRKYIQAGTIDSSERNHD